MKKYIFMSILFIHLILCHAQISNESSDWKNVFILIDENTTFYDCDFKTINMGWVLALARVDSKNCRLVGHTINGGIDWDTTLIQVPYQPAFISFATNSIGLMGKSNIYKTTDGGKTWVRKFMLYSESLSRLLFASENIAFGAGTHGTIIKTTDAGETWFNIDADISNKNFLIRNISIIDTQTVFGITQQELYLTENGGEKWEKVTLPNDLIGGAEDVFFISPDSGWVAGWYNKIFFTKDRGNSWIEQTPEFSTDAIRSIDVYNKKHVLIVNSHGAIYRSNDAGRIWEKQHSPQNRTFLHRCQILNENVAYAVGVNGLVLKTTNGGSTFLSENQSIIPKKYYLSNNYPNPFNPSTNITFELPESGFVEITLYDIRGRELKKLLSENKRSGSYQLSINLAEYPSGVYLYTLQTENYSQTNKMILLK